MVEIYKNSFASILALHQPDCFLRQRSYLAITVTAENAVAETQRVIRKRLGDFMAPNEKDPSVVSAKTSFFPFSLLVKCIRCSQCIRVCISKDKRSAHYFNIQTFKYTQHVRICEGDVKVYHA